MDKSKKYVQKFCCIIIYFKDKNLSSGDYIMMNQCIGSNKIKSEFFKKFNQSFL